jgi:hypothetical protein
METLKIVGMIIPGLTIYAVIAVMIGRFCGLSNTDDHDEF